MRGYLTLRWRNEDRTLMHCVRCRLALFCGAVLLCCIFSTAVVSPIVYRPSYIAHRISSYMYWPNLTLRSVGLSDLLLF